MPVIRVSFNAAPKRAFPFLLEDALIAHKRPCDKARQTAGCGVIPPPLIDSPKCVRCSLSAICLPDEINLFNEGLPKKPADDDTIRRLIPVRDDALPLYVQEQGARIGKQGECFRVSLKNVKLGEARIFETSQVCVFGNIQITTKPCRKCSRAIYQWLYPRWVGLWNAMLDQKISNSAVAV